MSSVPPPLRTEGDPPPAPPEPSRYLKCDFCECQLTKNGEVYRVSEKAREYRDEKEKHIKQVAKLDEEIAKLREDLTKKETELAQLRASAGEKRKSGFL
jgi:hypothetical protein